MSPSPFCQCRLHPASSLSQSIYNLKTSSLHASMLPSVLFLCLTEFIVAFGHADSECWSYSNTFSLSMLLNVSSKPSEVTHSDHRGADTLALNNFKNKTEQPKTDEFSVVALLLTFSFFHFALKVELRRSFKRLLPFYGCAKNSIPSGRGHHF